MMYLGPRYAPHLDIFIVRNFTPLFPSQPHILPTILDIFFLVNLISLSLSLSLSHTHSSGIGYFLDIIPTWRLILRLLAALSV